MCSQVWEQLSQRHYNQIVRGKYLKEELGKEAKGSRKLSQQSCPVYIVCEVSDEKLWMEEKQQLSGL